MVSGSESKRVEEVENMEPPAKKSKVDVSLLNILGIDLNSSNAAQSSSSSSTTTGNNKVLPTNTSSTTRGKIGISSSNNTKNMMMVVNTLVGTTTTNGGGNATIIKDSGNSKTGPISVWEGFRNKSGMDSFSSQSFVATEIPKSMNLEKGKAIPFQLLADALTCIEEGIGSGKGSNKQKLIVLTNVFRTILFYKPEELIAACYFLLSKVAPDYENIEIGIGDGLIFKAVATSFSTNVQTLQDMIARGEAQDVGEVALIYKMRTKQIQKPARLTILKVFTEVKDKIAKAEGKASQKIKTETMGKLIAASQRDEVKYLVRSFQGKLRVGINNATILTALAYAHVFSKRDFDEITFMKQTDNELENALIKMELAVKKAYCEHPNYEKICQFLSSSTDVNIDNMTPEKLNRICKITPGVPLKPMLAKPSKGITEVMERLSGLKFTAEYKYDGERAQIHVFNLATNNVVASNSVSNNVASSIINKSKAALIPKSTIKSSILVAKKPIGLMGLLGGGATATTNSNTAASTTASSKSITTASSVPTTSADTAPTSAIPSCSSSVKNDVTSSSTTTGNQAIRVYSRNSENMTVKYPDLVEIIKKNLRPNVKSVIIDAEVVAYDPETKSIQPFQKLATRSKKNVDINEIKVQVCLFVFDLIYLNGKKWTGKPLRERREALKTEALFFKEGTLHFASGKDFQLLQDSNINSSASSTTKLLTDIKELEKQEEKKFTAGCGCVTTTDANNGTELVTAYDASSFEEELQNYLNAAINGSCEGLMLKTLDDNATYEPSKRSLNWLKLKKDYLDGLGDSVDVVVVGAWYGTGKRTGVFGSYLLCCYNQESGMFETLCKAGTGYSDEALQQHYSFFKDKTIPNPEGNVEYSDNPNVIPDVWLKICQVWEVKAADLSISPVHTAATGLSHPEKGIALRFPRFIRIRDDKGPEDATSSEQISQMYQQQSVIAGAAVANEEGDGDLL